MDGFKDLFQGRALSYEEFEAAFKEKKGRTLEGKDDFVERILYEAVLQELEKARTTIADLQRQVEGWIQKYSVDMAKMRRDAAVDREILRAGGRNVKAIRALINLDQVVLNEDGSLSGLDLDALKVSDSYLFNLESWDTMGPGFMPNTMVNSEQSRVKEQFEKAVWRR